MRKRLLKKDRKREILTAAVHIAKVNGYHAVTREDIAARANASAGLITFYFSTMKQLKRAIMREAINKEVLEIIAVGLAAQDSQAKKDPKELKEKAIKFMVV